MYFIFTSLSDFSSFFEGKSLRIFLHCCQYCSCFSKPYTHLEFSTLHHFKVCFCNWNCCLDQKVVIWSSTCNSQYFFSVSLYAHIKSVIKAVFLKSLILQKLMCIHPLALPYKANHLCLIGSLLFQFCVFLWGYCKVLWSNFMT